MKIEVQLFAGEWLSHENGGIDVFEVSYGYYMNLPKCTPPDSSLSV